MFKSFAFVLFVALFFGGCALAPIKFDVPVSGETTVEKGTLVESLTSNLGFSSLTTFDLSQTQSFQNNNAEKRHVSKAQLTLLRLSIQSPSEQDFDFLEEISFFIEAPGLPKKRVAFKAIEKGKKTFDCVLDEVDLAPYIKADTLSLTTSVKGKRPNQDTVIKAEAVFSIEAVL